MKPSIERLHKAALHAVACNTIMLGVCDDLKETSLYKQRPKHLINELTRELEKFVATMYRGISPVEETEFNNLVRVVEGAASLMATMAPEQVNGFSALILAYRNGDVFVPTTDKQMENIIKQGKVKKLQVSIAGM